MKKQYETQIEAASQAPWDMKKIAIFAMILIIIIVAVPVYLLLFPIQPPAPGGEEEDFTAAALNQYLENMGLRCEAIDVTQDNVWYMCNGRPYLISLTGEPTATQFYNNQTFNITDSYHGFDYIEDAENYSYYKSEQIGNNIVLYFHNLDQGTRYTFSLDDMEVASSSTYDFISELENDFNSIYSSSCTVDDIWLCETCGAPFTNFNVTCGATSGTSVIINLQLIPPFLDSGDTIGNLETSFNFVLPECELTTVNESEYSATGTCDGFDAAIIYSNTAPRYSVVEFEPTTLSVGGMIDYIMSNTKYLFSQHDLSSVDFALDNTEDIFYLTENCTFYHYNPFTLNIIECGDMIKRVIPCAGNYC